MADERTRRWRDRLGTRLAAAFMVTTLATVAVVTAIAWTASSTGADALLAQRREQVADDVVAALATAYLVAGGWEGADLLPAHTVAAAAGAVLIVTAPELGELPTPPALGLTRRRLQDLPDATSPRTDERAGDDGGGAQRPRTEDPPDGPNPATTSDPGEAGTDEQPPKDGQSDDPGPGVGPAPEEPVRQRQTEGESTTPPDTGQGPLAPEEEPSGHQQHGSGPDEPRAAPAVASMASWRPDRPISLMAAGPTPVSAADTDGERRELPIVVGGQEVGTATLVFVGLDLADPEDGFRDAVARRLTLGAGVALVLALLATAFVTSRLTRPLRTLTAEVDRLRAAGSRPVRLPVANAPGEIAVLSDALARMADDLGRQERLRQALVADVEHELRTPVTILLGELEALRDGVLTVDEEQLGSLQEEVQRIARLVEDVGALADAEAVGFTLDVTPLDLAALTATATRGLETPLAAADLELELRLEHVEIDGDARRLEQLVRNLLTNAAKYATPGTTIEVSVGADGDHAVLSVEDRGPGFDASELPHVFTRFWRGRQVVGLGGSGIGLAVVEEIARAHGGTAAASNRPDGGARVTVRLPRIVQPTSEVARDRAVPVGPGLDSGGHSDGASSPPPGQKGE
jgi:two-component system, OmpR family, sensor histidine kinase BaeS